MQIQKIPGCGPKRAQALAEYGILSIRQFLYLLPRRYEDRRVIKSLASIQEESPCQVFGKITHSEKKGMGPKQRLVLTLEDESGEGNLVFFHGVPFWEKQLYIGRSLLVYGAPKFFGGWQWVHPELSYFESPQEADLRIHPIYPQSEILSNAKISQGWLRKSIEYVLKQISLPDPINSSWREKLDLFPEIKMLQHLHFPENFEEQSTAFLQLKMRELLPLIYRFEINSRSRQGRGVALGEGELWLKKLESHLPFQLTSYQRDVILEIQSQLQKNTQMWGLLQGDVGAGKTIVAFAVSGCAWTSNKQVVWLAPTEILARQHFQNLEPLATHLGISVKLLLGANSTSERLELLNQLKSGSIQFLIGTHAVFSSDVCFNDLGLVVIDEQHRFGVDQRMSLIQKGKSPHVLYMSATPIPRTLAQSIFGDIQVYTLKGKPEGRKEIKTSVVPLVKRSGMLKYLLEQIQKSEQVFWVVPRIQGGGEEKSSSLQQYPQGELYTFDKDLFSEISGPEKLPIPLRSIEEIVNELRKYSSKWRIGAIHGRQKKEEQDSVMNQFAGGKIDILVATSIIEVGVDIPGANYLVIENPERFGFSQLHQLRGRVGRSSSQGWCFLAEPEQPWPEQTRDRLLEFSKESDGFKIAEMDLERRGAGDLGGDIQSGWGALRYANFVVDADLIHSIRDLLRSSESIDNIFLSKN